MSDTIELHRAFAALVLADSDSLIALAATEFAFEHLRLLVRNLLDDGELRTRLEPLLDDILEAARRNPIILVPKAR